MEFLQKVKNNIYFKPVLSVILIVLPLIGLYYVSGEVCVVYGSKGSYNWWPLLPILLLEIAGLILLIRQTSLRYTVGGAAWYAVISFPFVLYFCEEWLFRGNLSDMLKFVFVTHFYMTLFMVAILTAIFWLLNCIWRRFWISAALMSTVLMILSYINLAKWNINGEPFLPSDFSFITTLGEVTGFAGGSLPFTKELVFGIIILLGIILILFFGQKKTPKNWILRVAISLFCIAFIGVTVLLPKVKDFIFLGDNIAMSKQYIQKHIYDFHGFMGGFVINIEGYTPPPDGYSKKNVGTLLKNYETEPQGAFENPDVIVYLSESMFDITEVDGVTFTKDPLKNIHRIQKENGLNGMMLQASGVGGGTVRSEFEVLTGVNLVDMKEGLIPYSTYVAKSSALVNGLPNYFKTLGYSTTAIHSYSKEFYSRNICYNQMGFDTFIGSEDMTDAEIGDSIRGFILDSYFEKQVEKQLEKDEGPQFIFAISMENHGAFTGKYKSAEPVASCDTWTDADTDIANNYCKSTAAADEAIGVLYDYVMKRKKPTVVLVFGDHLPTLGERHTVLTDAGFISTGWSSNWTQQDIYNMYRTPFVVFSNYIDGKPENVGDYSSYMLPSILLDYIHAPKNGYWNLISELRDNVRVYNRYLTVDHNDKISEVDTLDEKSKQLIEEHTLLSYDALVGKHYINNILLKEESK